MADIIYKEKSFKLLGACFEVYMDKGCGFHEPVYRESLGIEFRLQQIPAIPKPRLELEYKGQKLEQRFEPDYVTYSKIIVELKALSHLTDEYEAQVMNYLKATKFKLGLLVNFGHHPKLECRRIVAHDSWSAHELEPPDFRK
jgi:GxxExxY protein